MVGKCLQWGVVLEPYCWWCPKEVFWIYGVPSHPVYGANVRIDLFLFTLLLFPSSSACSCRWLQNYQQGYHWYYQQVYKTDCSDTVDDAQAKRKGRGTIGQEKVSTNNIGFPFHREGQEKKCQWQWWDLFFSFPFSPLSTRPHQNVVWYNNSWCFLKILNYVPKEREKYTNKVLVTDKCCDGS